MGKYRTLSEVEEDTFWQKSEEEIYAAGELKGMLEGELKCKLELAKKMLQDGVDISAISKWTGFDAGYIMGSRV